MCDCGISGIFWSYSLHFPVYKHVLNNKDKVTIALLGEHSLSACVHAVGDNRNVEWTCRNVGNFR